MAGAALDDTLYNGQFSGLAREVNAIGYVWQARSLDDSTAHVLDLATGYTDELPGGLQATVFDLPLSSAQAKADINAARVRIATAMAALDGYADGDAIPDVAVKEIRAALINGWSEAYAVAGVAEHSDSLAAELLKVSQNLHEAPGALADIGDSVAKVADAEATALAKVLRKILDAFAAQLWPWLLVAGIVFLVVEFGPELRALVAGFIKVKTPGGAA